MNFTQMQRSAFNSQCYIIKLPTTNRESSCGWFSCAAFLCGFYPDDYRDSFAEAKESKSKNHKLDSFYSFFKGKKQERYSVAEYPSAPVPRSAGTFPRSATFISQAIAAAIRLHHEFNVQTSNPQAKPQAGNNTPQYNSPAHARTRFFLQAPATVVA
jgi:hypothetical protein